MYIVIGNRHELIILHFIGQVLCDITEYLLVIYTRINFIRFHFRKYQYSAPDVIEIIITITTKTCTLF